MVFFRVFWGAVLLGLRRAVFMFFAVFFRGFLDLWILTDFNICAVYLVRVGLYRRP